MNPRKEKAGTALITGAANRIGKAICLHLAGQGYKIALHYATAKAAAQDTATEIRNAGGVCEIFQSDFTRQPAAERLLPAVAKKFSDLNLLVNNASVFQKSSLTPKDIKIFDPIFNVNFKAPFILTCQFSQTCRKGSVINILDTHIVKNNSPYVAYLLAKKLLAELTKLAGVELAPGIRVNAIAPGLILPPAGKNEKYLKEIAKKIPLRRQGDPEWITQAVQFLIESECVTGQIIFADGGEHLL